MKWTIEKYHYGINSYMYDIKEGENWVCEIDNHEPYARLIACAPELLEALEEVTDLWVRNLTYQQYTEVKQIFLKVENLIKKAKGE